MSRVIPDKVRRVLERAGLEAVEFDEGTTPTAPMAAAALGVEVGQIAKSLLFKSKDGRFYMVVCPGDRRVNNAKLKAGPIYPAAGTDGSGVPMTLAQLESVTGARVADLTEPSVSADAGRVGGHID